MKLKTLDQLREALRGLVPASEDAQTESKKIVATTHKMNCRLVSVFFSGEIHWRLPESRGGSLLVTEIGNTLQDVYDNCRIALTRELEERGRARRLTATPARKVLPAPAPRRLEYQP